jgi:hypothetical protein
VVGGPNRNLADFFQVAIDPLGHALIAFADDANDFSGHTSVTHQLSGPSLHTGTMLSVSAPEPAEPSAALPEVGDWRHDARLAGNPPIYPSQNTPVDIISIDFGCAQSANGLFVTATLRASGLDLLPPNGIWRMNFATNATRRGVSDRADQWFLMAETSAAGVPTYSYGTAVRNRDGTLTYTRRGVADSGRFDLTTRSLTLSVDTAKLNALQTRGPVGAGTILLGLRGSASVTLNVAGAAAQSVISDATRGGRTTTLGHDCSGALSF